MFVAPRRRGRRGSAMSMSVRRHFTIFAVQGAFLHLASPFFVCRSYGSFIDLKKIIFLGSKIVKLGTKNLHFQYKSVFSSAKQRIQIQVDPKWPLNDTTWPHLTLIGPLCDPIWPQDDPYMTLKRPLDYPKMTPPDPYMTPSWPLDDPRWPTNVP